MYFESAIKLMRSNFNYLVLLLFWEIYFDNICSKLMKMLHLTYSEIELSKRNYFFDLLSSKSLKLVYVQPNLLTLKGTSDNENINFT